MSGTALLSQSVAWRDLVGILADYSSNFACSQ